MWVAITALDAVDKGRVSLDQPVTLTRDDLTLFHQPIAEEVLKTGSFTTTERVITLSGTVTSNGSVARVWFRSDRGFSWTASGTTDWRVPDLPLKSGLSKHLSEVGCYTRRFSGGGRDPRHPPEVRSRHS